MFECFIAKHASFVPLSRANLEFQIPNSRSQILPGIRFLVFALPLSFRSHSMLPPCAGLAPPNGADNLCVRLDLRRCAAFSIVSRKRLVFQRSKSSDHLPLIRAISCYFVLIRGSGFFLSPRITKHTNGHELCVSAAMPPAYAGGSALPLPLECLALTHGQASAKNRRTHPIPRAVLTTDNGPTGRRQHFDDSTTNARGEMSDFPKRRVFPERPRSSGNGAVFLILHTFPTSACRVICLCGLRNAIIFLLYTRFGLTQGRLRSTHGL